MSKRYYIMATVLALLIALLVFAEASKPEELNWFPTYRKTDKIPLGTYVFYDQLQKQKYAENAEEVKIPPFEFIGDSLENGTYLFVNDAVNFDDSEAKKLLNWVSRGNTLFVSATYQSQLLLDTLNLEIASFYERGTMVRKPLLNFSNPKLKRDLPYFMNKDLGSSYFNKIDTLKTTVLGVYDLIRDGDSTKIQEPKINFIQVPFENGTVYLHLFPQAFTNYFMLENDNSAYTASVLAYLPDGKKLFVDQYYKSGKTFNTSPLFVIFGNKYLKWSYYLILITGLLWVIFEGKRKQRSIAIVKPLPNQTLAFTRTIAGMYLEKKEHKQIALHQINHFLEFLRSTYNTSTAQLNLPFIKTIAAKSSVEEGKVRNLIDYIIALRQKQEVTESELIQLNGLIEKFKSKT